MKASSRKPSPLLMLSLAIEGSLLVAAITWACWSGMVHKFPFDFEWGMVILGALVALPMVAAFFLLLRLNWKPIQNIKCLLNETLMPMIRESSICELALISLLAGFGEELLFRYCIQNLLVERWGILAGVLISSILFGFGHFVTRLYVVFATIVGIFLGWLLIITGSIWAPITTHAVYDFLALGYFFKRGVGSPEKVE